MPAFSGCSIYLCLDPSNAGVKPEYATTWIQEGGGSVAESPAGASHIVLQHLEQEQAAVLGAAGFSDKFCSLVWFFACLEAKEPLVAAAHPLYTVFPSRAIEGAAQLGEVCQSGFSSTWRYMFASLLISMGAKFSKDLRFVLDGAADNAAQQTALLVCHDVASDSAKARAARDYGIPIINMQWVLDCLKSWTLLPTAPYTADAPVTLVHFLPSLPAVTQGMVAESEDDEADVDPIAPLMPQSIRSAATAPAPGTAQAAAEGTEQQQQQPVGPSAAAVMPHSAPINPAQQLKPPAAPPGTVVGSGGGGGDGGKKAGKPAWHTSGGGSAAQQIKYEKKKQEERALSQSPSPPPQQEQHGKQQASATEVFYSVDTKKQLSSTGRGAGERQWKEQRPGSAGGGGHSDSSMMAGLLGVNAQGATQAMANVGNLATALVGATEAQERCEHRPLPLSRPRPAAAAAAAAAVEEEEGTPTPSDLSLNSAHGGRKTAVLETEDMAVDGPQAAALEEEEAVQPPLPVTATEVIEVEGDEEVEGDVNAGSEVKSPEAAAAAAEPPPPLAVVSRAADVEEAVAEDEAPEARGAKRTFRREKKAAAAVGEEADAAPLPPLKPRGAKKAPAAVKKEDKKAPAAARKKQPPNKRSAAAAAAAAEKEKVEAGPSGPAKKRRRGGAAPSDHQPACHITFSGMHTVEQQALTAKLQPLGAQVTAGTHEWSDSYTHVIAPSVRRNAKCLAALAAGSWLVGPGFAAACRSARKVVDAEPHELDVGDAGVVAPGVAQWWRQRRASTGGGAFAGLTFAVAQKIDEPPTRGELLSILEAGGATVVPVSSQKEMADVVVAAAAAAMPSVQQRIKQGAMAVTPKWVVEFLALPEASLRAHRLAGTAPNARVAAAEAGRAPEPDSSVSL